MKPICTVRSMINGYTWDGDEWKWWLGATLFRVLFMFCFLLWVRPPRWFGCGNLLFSNNMCTVFIYKSIMTFKALGWGKICQHSQRTHRSELYPTWHLKEQFPMDRNWSNRNNCFYWASFHSLSLISFSNISTILTVAYLTGTPRANQSLFKPFFL